MIDVKARWNTQCTDNHKFWRILISCQANEIIWKGDVVIVK